MSPIALLAFSLWKHVEFLICAIITLNVTFIGALLTHCYEYLKRSHSPCWGFVRSSPGICHLMASLTLVTTGGGILLSSRPKWTAFFKVNSGFVAGATHVAGTWIQTWKMYHGWFSICVDDKVQCRILNGKMGSLGDFKECASRLALHINPIQNCWLRSPPETTKWVKDPQNVHPTCPWLIWVHFRGP